MNNERADAFKVGFLTKLAELGLTPSEFHQRVKLAFIDPGSLASSVLSGAGEVGKAAISGIGMAGTAAKAGLGVAAGAPLVLGAASGAADAALNAPSSED